VSNVERLLAHDDAVVREAFEKEGIVVDIVFYMGGLDRNVLCMCVTAKCDRATMHRVWDGTDLASFSTSCFSLVAKEDHD